MRSTMTKKFCTSLFIFRRDLRLEDNTGLIFALKYSEIVIPAFIFTPEQIERNPFKSEHCLKFMLESLQDLEGQLKKKKGKLFLFNGKADAVVQQLLNRFTIDALIVNRDYTPYSQKRDKKLENLCQKKGVVFYSFDDALLHPPEKTVKKDGSPYTIFTPYFRNASKQKVLAPTRNLRSNYFHHSIPFSKESSFLSKMLSHYTEKNGIKGGRREGLKILKNLSKFRNYEKIHDFPQETSTTHLSPYLKFTVCSPREVYAAISYQLGMHHALIRSLYWRDFFTSLAFFFPHVFKGSFHTKFNRLKWSRNKNHYRRWCEGFTGFPLVDAGMREMNATGFMPNRVRMIAASLLIKDLHINWRWGEKYFAQTLIDYDPAVNNGNWQWVASTGSDSQPYFRIFNPWTQQKTFDPKCLYIKKWIPELHNVPINIIHTWYEKKVHPLCKEYPPPLANHESEAKAALQAYKHC